MSQKGIGHANCPNCGIISIPSIENITIHIPMGLANPFALIICQKCGENFLATVEWKSAWVFDAMGCKIVGFSKRLAEPITDEEISRFMDNFDDKVEKFLSLIDSEQQ